jgi:D-alanine-D-alanine ligase
VNLRQLREGVIAVLLGGNSAEREVSLLSGATVASAFESAGFNVRKVDPADDNWLLQLEGVSFAFNALHGPGGEDGVIQGVLVALGIHYSGSGILGSALSMDKIRTKQLWQGIGLPTAGFIRLQADTNWQAVIDEFTKVFVKPACEGSSIGMMSADNAADLQRAFSLARAYQGEVMAEQFIDGPEYTVAVLGGATLPSIRMETDNDFYDYEAKYLSDDTRYHCPSDLGPEDELEISKLALKAFESLDCSVWGRVDIMRDMDGTFYLLEVNTIPGMTSHSLVPMAAEAAGMDIVALVQKILVLSAQERS